jgi:hypothetical protein
MKLVIKQVQNVQLKIYQKGFVKMENIDITMTATLRPEIFRSTVDDIFKYIIGRHNNKYYRLILNIDCVGENIKPKEIVKIAERSFINIKYNISKTPSFPKAVKWVWSQATSNYIFHIEDDWKFLRKINVDNMIRILKNHNDLSSLRLYKYNTPNQKIIKTFMCKWDYQEDGFYLARDWKKQFGLNPILIKKEFIDEALPKMVDHINPEKQFRYSQEFMRDIIKKWKYGLYCSPNQTKSIEDSGRSWANRNKISKPKKGPFITWESN